MQLIVNARFLTQPLSGVQRYGIACSRQIKRLLPDVQFVAPGNIQHRHIAEELGVTIIGTRTGHIWEQFDLPRYLRRLGYPPLLCLGNTAPVRYPNTFTTIHDLAFLKHPEWNSRLFSGWYQWLVPKNAGKAKHIFTVSNTIKQELVDELQLPADKVSVTYTGTPEEFVSSSPAPAREKMILAVGSSNPRKNHTTLIKAFLASERLSEYELHIAGNPSSIYRGDRSLTSTRVNYHRNIDDAALANLYQRAALMVSLSKYEGFGAPVIEALSFGCRVLCSDIPVYRELFTGYVDFCDINNLTNTIVSLEQSTLSANGRGICNLPQNYSFDYAAHTILKTITASREFADAAGAGS